MASGRQFTFPIPAQRVIRNVSHGEALTPPNAVAQAADVDAFCFIYPLNATVFTDFKGSKAYAYRVLGIDITGENVNAEGTVLAGIGNSIYTTAQQAVGISAVSNALNELSVLKRSPVGGGIARFRWNNPNPMWMSVNETNGLCCPMMVLGFMTTRAIKKGDLTTRCYLQYSITYEQYIP